MIMILYKQTKNRLESSQVSRPNFCHDKQTFYSRFSGLLKNYCQLSNFRVAIGVWNHGLAYCTFQLSIERRFLGDGMTARESWYNDRPFTLKNDRHYQKVPGRGRQ